MEKTPTQIIELNSDDSEQLERLMELLKASLLGADSRDSEPTPEHILQ